VWILLADSARQSQAIEVARQHHVGEHQVDGFPGGKEIERSFRAFDCYRAVVELLQCRGHGFHIRVVLDNEDHLALAA
jgi:hypothetical protein